VTALVYRWQIQAVLRKSYGVGDEEHENASCRCLGTGRLEFAKRKLKYVVSGFDESSFLITCVTYRTLPEAQIFIRIHRSFDRLSNV
jgi:hypothetical protein